MSKLTKVAALLVSNVAAKYGREGVDAFHTACLNYRESSAVKTRHYRSGFRRTDKQIYDDLYWLRTKFSEAPGKVFKLKTFSSRYRSRQQLYSDIRVLHEDEGFIIQISKGKYQRTPAEELTSEDFKWVRELEAQLADPFDDDDDDE